MSYHGGALEAVCQAGPNNKHLGRPSQRSLQFVASPDQLSKRASRAIVNAAQTMKVPLKPRSNMAAPRSRHRNALREFGFVRSLTNRGPILGRRRPLMGSLTRF